jgi:hypothetical protein
MLFWYLAYTSPMQIAREIRQKNNSSIAGPMVTDDDTPQIWASYIESPKKSMKVPKLHMKELARSLI